MRIFNFLALSTIPLISTTTVFAQTQTQTQTQQNATTVFDPTKDNYPFKTTITNATLNGFTIEYKNYYKVVTNLLTQQRYCLVGWNQSLPTGCQDATSFSTPVTEFNIDTDSYNAMPYIELLGLQSKLSSSINTQNVTSPCLTDGSKSTAITAAQFTFSFQTFGAKYVSFSGNDDSLGPLNKAAWLLYVGAFFDMELKAYQTYSQIVNNYNCHKNNLGTVASSPKIVSWTTYDAIHGVYTVHGDNYFTQLAQDAGAVLRAPNKLQENNFNANDTVALHSLALALQGSDYIIDTSLPSVNYDTWYSKGGTYFTPNNSFAHIGAIANNQVYSYNGLVSANNLSDWSQRSAARPDLALLDLVKLFYPSFSIVGTESFPVWLVPLPTMATARQVINQATYGNCNNLAQSAFTQTACALGGNGYSQIKKATDLSTGDKAGISVGAVLFVIVAGLVGIWLYRKYRRNKRHNFYRMHDLN